MVTVNAEFYDSGLDWVIANATQLNLCTQEPTTYAEATSTYSIGSAAVTLTGPAAGATDGRKVTVPAITGGSITADGTATHFALTDGSSVFVLAAALTSSQAFLTGDTFSTSAQTITKRLPAVV